MLQQPSQPSDRTSPNMFSGDGEMATLMRSYNWDNHPLGSAAKWPISLQANIRLMLNSAFPMFIWWSDSFYMFHNDAYLPALGKKHPEALGASARDMWAEIWGHLGVVAEGILENANQFYAKEMLVLLDRQGFIEETYWTFSYSPIFNDEGEVAGVFCACNEVTSTVLGQRRLKTLKEISDAMNLVQTLEEACQAASTALYHDSKDIPFNLIYLLSGSGKEARLVGCSGNMKPEFVQPLIHLTKDKNLKWPLLQVQQEGQGVVVEGLSNDDFYSSGNFQIGFPDKAVVYPIFRPGEEVIIGFFISGISPQLSYDQDYISFHKLLARQFSTLIASTQSRIELARQQEYLIELFEQAPVGITVMSGSDFIVRLANKGICEIWGRTSEEVLGKPVFEALPEVLDQGIKEILDDVYTSGIPYLNNELPVKLERNGKLETVYVNLVYQPMRDANNDIIGVIAIAIDINEQVEARREIVVMNKELIAINADLDNFVYSASHDLKAPISNIEGLMEALVENLSADIMASGEVPKLINYIQGSIERFKRAVKDLTQVARVQRESEQDITHVSLSDMVDEILLDFNGAITTIGAEVIKEISPESTIQLSVKNARSVIYNLISNALKYSSSERKPRIKITTEETPEFVVLSVSDNGLGMDLKGDNKIFTMFKRLHDHVEGTGVGLYIVKKIVDNAGGKIEVESSVGQGSSFKVYLKR
ncbi:ATP-binding protein [Pontibacter sp. MBLB2868]|uniref:PAS domain-containing sensor histidine kinase n=1 Tax=Pontibacter sp. MBLB2868 TaxID=3451555 RepID=UPI003F74C74C